MSQLATLTDETNDIIPTIEDLNKQISINADKNNNTNKTRKKKVAKPKPTIDDLGYDTDQLTYRTQLINKVEQYRATFEIQKKPIKINIKTTIEELEIELDCIQTELNSKGSLDSAKVALVGVMSLVEHTTANIWNPLKLNLKGLSAVTKDNLKVYEECLKELLLKYDLFQTGPEMRFTMLLIQTIQTVDAKNKELLKNGQKKEEINNEVPEEAKDEKYKDL